MQRVVLDAPPACKKPQLLPTTVDENRILEIDLMDQSDRARQSLTRCRGQILSALSAFYCYAEFISAAEKTGWDNATDSPSSAHRALANIGAIGLEQSLIKTHALFDGHPKAWSLADTTNQNKSGLFRSDATVQLWRKLNKSPHSSTKTKVKKARGSIAAHIDPLIDPVQLLDELAIGLSEVSELLEAAGQYVAALHTDNVTVIDQSNLSNEFYVHHAVRTRIVADMRGLYRLVAVRELN